MTKYGKIYIEANSIEEAERELEMIKSLVRLGAVKGQGSTSTGKIEMEMRPTSAIAEAPSNNYRCTDCSICPHRCREETYHYDEADEYDEDDFYGTDDYEDEEVDAMIDTIGRLINDYCEGGANLYELLDGIRSAIID